MFCEIDSWVPGGMQFGVLVQELFGGAGDGAGAFLQIDGWVLGLGYYLGALCGRMFARLTAGCWVTVLFGGAVRGDGAGAFSLEGVLTSQEGQALCEFGPGWCRRLVRVLLWVLVRVLFDVLASACRVLKVVWWLMGCCQCSHIECW